MRSLNDHRRCQPEPVLPACRAQSQIRYINDTGYRATMEGVIAAEGYHAGGVRELLIQQAGAAVSPYGLSVNQVAQVRDRRRCCVAAPALSVDARKHFVVVLQVKCTLFSLKPPWFHRPQVSSSARLCGSGGVLLIRAAQSPSFGSHPFIH